jgi:hypothetical protein
LIDAGSRYAQLLRSQYWSPERLHDYQQERLAGARFHHHQFCARDVEFFLGGFDHIILP